MKCCTILALLALVCAVFLGGGRSEDTPELHDFQGTFEDTENDGELADSFIDSENDDKENDDETDNALQSVDEKSNVDDDEEPEMFKRSPWRRRRFRLRRIRLRKIRLRKIRLRKIRKVFRKIKDGFKKACRWVKKKNWKWAKKVCKKYGDEESLPKFNDEIPNEQVNDNPAEDGWLEEE